MFYDGQGFMVPTDLEVSGMMELGGAAVCVQQGTTTELNLQDFINQNNLNITVSTFPDNTSANEAYTAGTCDALTTDRSGLVSTRAGLDHPEEHVILPGTISEEPLGPVVPHGDEEWYDIVTTVMGILIYAEAFGITADSVPTPPPAKLPLTGCSGCPAPTARRKSAWTPPSPRMSSARWATTVKSTTATSPPWASPARAAATPCGAPPLHRLPQRRPDLHRAPALNIRPLATATGSRRLCCRRLLYNSTRHSGTFNPSFRLAPESNAIQDSSTRSSRRRPPFLRYNPDSTLPPGA